MPHSFSFFAEVPSMIFFLGGWGRLISVADFFPPFYQPFSEWLFMAVLFAFLSAFVVADPSANSLFFSSEFRLRST